MTTKAEQARFRKLQSLGCICCIKEKLGFVVPEIHHIVNMGYRRLSGGHASTLPLDPWHHRGLPPEGMTAAEALYTMGPSLALNKRLFVQTYGDELSLLAEVNRMIGTV